MARTRPRGAWRHRWCGAPALADTAIGVQSIEARASDTASLHVRPLQAAYALVCSVPVPRFCSESWSGRNRVVNCRHERHYHCLLESLDNRPEREAKALWLDVAERRAREIDEGQVQLVTPDELARRAEAQLT